MKIWIFSTNEYSSYCVGSTTPKQHQTHHANGDPNQFANVLATLNRIHV